MTTHPGHAIKRWQPHEDRLLIKLYETSHNYSFTTIGRRLKRSKDSIKSRVHWLIAIGELEKRVGPTAGVTKLKPGDPTPDELFAQAMAGRRFDRVAREAAA